MRHTNELLSRPLDIHWAGWRANTYDLQQQGWSLSADQDVCRMTIRIALRNERAGMVGVTEITDFRYYDAAHNWDYPLPSLRMQMMAHKIEVEHSMGFNPYEQFRPIDAQPQMIQRERKSLEDLVHFAPSLARTQQIIVPEENVDDLMARILEMQQGPRIERIRQEIREGEVIRPNASPKQNFHAQIISLAA